jgi:hypothetical protein
MHVTKNVFDNIIGRLLDMPMKMKDKLKSHNDLVQFGLRPELHPMLRPNVKHYLPPVSYSLTVEEKKYSVSACVGCEHPHVFHPTSPNYERVVYVRLQFTRLSYDDDGFSRNHNKGHQIDAYQSTHHTLVLLY